MTETVLGPDHPEVVENLGVLAQIYRAERKLDESQRCYARIVTIKEKALGPEHPDLVAPLEQAAETLKELKRDGDAQLLEERAKAIRDRETHSSID